LSVLAHAQAAVFAAVSVLVLVVHAAPNRRLALFNIAVASVAGAVVIAPWLLTVLGTHGPGPLVSASLTGGSPLDGLRTLLSLRFSGAAVEILGALAGFGLFVALLNRRWWIPVWILALFMVGARKSLIFATVPAAASIALGLADIFRVLRIPEDWLKLKSPPAKAAAICALLFGAALISAGASLYVPGSPLRPLSHQQRAAMEWVSRGTPSDSRFLIVSGTAWNLDSAAEWFPVMADRTSVVTVQGWEWLGQNAFEEQRLRHEWLQRCASQVESLCVGEWTSVVGPIDYVYLSERQEAGADGRRCCGHLADQIEDKLDGTRVFENDHVLIVRLPGADGTAREQRHSGVLVSTQISGHP
jgi:hypothetical protein